MQDTVYCQDCGAHMRYGQSHECLQKSIPPEIMEMRVLELEYRLHQLDEILSHLLDRQREKVLHGCYSDLEKIRDEVRSALK